MKTDIEVNWEQEGMNLEPGSDKGEHDRPQRLKEFLLLRLGHIDLHLSRLSSFLGPLQLVTRPNPRPNSESARVTTLSGCNSSNCSCSPA